MWAKLTNDFMNFEIILFLITHAQLPYMEIILLKDDQKVCSSYFFHPLPFHTIY